MLTVELTPPVSMELLTRYDFFELYELDGGGRFIMRELFGTLEDSVIADTLLNTPLMDEFGGLDAIDFGKFEKWRTIEKSCWINRCYFIIPLAKKAFVDQDKTLARRVLQIMLNFGRNYPAPDDLPAHWQRVTRRMTEDYNSKTAEAIAVDETNVEYIWYDMQVAQRLISFMYAAFFIRDLLPAQTQELAELSCLLKKHARTIADQEALRTSELDNHQSLRAIALYWALPLLKNDADYSIIHRRAFDLCCWHILNEFLAPSGALFENSPSYHAFVLWHARDFIAIANRRDEAIPPEVTTRFEAAKQALFAYRRPDGMALTINDSYQYDASPLAESLGGIKSSCSAMQVLKPGGLAAGQLGDCYAAMDVSNFTGEFSHYHGGKNSVVVMWKKEAFIEECGCPSYDAEEFTSCRRSDWHTTLLVDNIGDTHAYSMYGFDRWPELDYADNWQQNPDSSCSFSSTLSSNNSSWQAIKWRRLLTLRTDGVQLLDTVENGTSATHIYTLLINLAPGVEIESISPTRWQLKKCGYTCSMELTCGTAPRSVRIREIKNCQQRFPRKMQQLQIEFSPSIALQSTLTLKF